MSGDPSSFPVPGDQTGEGAVPTESRAVEPGSGDSNPTGDTGGSGSIRALADRLMNTEPDRPLDQVSPVEAGRGGKLRILRGVQKVAGTDGTPAAFDLLLGVIEVGMEQQQAGGGIEDSDEQPDEGGGEIEAATDGIEAADEQPADEQPADAPADAPAAGDPNEGLPPELRE